MEDSIGKLLEGRRFRPPMRKALRLVASGEPVRVAAKAAGLASHQDVAKAARELGIGRRRGGGEEEGDEEQAA